MTFIKHAWYVAAHSHELEAEFVARTIANEPVVMYRTADGKVAAIADRCPHRFVPLSMGKRVGDSMQCGYHGLAFDSSGACSSAPNDPQQQARICVKAFAAVERYNVIWLWLGDAEQADPTLIPTFDFMSDPNYAVARGHSHIKANYELLADNLLDLSHVHYLHPEIHEGSADFASFTNKLKVEGDTVWSMLWRHHYALDEKKAIAMGFPPETTDVEGQGHSRWNVPGNLLVDTAYWQHGTGYDHGNKSPSAHLLTPETESTTHYFWASGRTHDIHNEPRTRITEERMHMIFETQDGPMCEAQQAYLGVNTDFLSAKPIILKADAAGVAARRVTRRKKREEAALFDTAAPADDSAEAIRGFAVVEDQPATVS